MNEVTVMTKTAIAVWEQTQEIRKIFAPKLTEPEFNFFLGLGKSLGANPFNREIWAVKYGDSAAQVFCGRDFYRRKAEEQPDYKGHVVEAYYQGDELVIERGMITRHVPDLKAPGKIMGAYCIVFREDKEPYVARVKFDEYNLGKSLWSSKPETMIKKVAEAQGLRGAYQGIFAGTYGEGEEWRDDTQTPKISTQLNDIPKGTNLSAETTKAEPDTDNAVKVWTKEEIKAVLDEEANLMVKIKKLTLKDMRFMFLKHCGNGESIKQELTQSLTEAEAQLFIKTLSDYAETQKGTDNGTETV